MIVSTPLAASTSSAVFCAGPDTACVSLPMKSGPEMFLLVRYSQIACVMARMCASLSVPSSGTAAVAAGAEAHQLLRIVRIGLALVVGFLELLDVDQDFAGAGFPARG